ncbi:MAG: helix-turn-helix domain-containing protein [Oscillospiraceae bacterium]
MSFRLEDRDIEMVKTIVSQLRSCRIQRKLSQSKLANLCGISVSEIKKLESGRNSNFSVVVLIRIMSCLGMEKLDFHRFWNS